MNFPIYVSPDIYKTVEIVGYIDPAEKVNKENLVVGKGYLYGVPSDTNSEEDEYKDIQVWIYSEKKPKMPDEYPYFWIEGEGDDEHVVFSNPEEEIRNTMKLGNTFDFSVEAVIENTEPGEVLFDSQEISDINSSTSNYLPEVYETDDFLKKAVKLTIINKGIDINRLKSKTDEPYQVLNMISSLRSGDPDKPGTKMSTKYFYNWMEILGCKFMLIIADNNTDTTDPLKNNVVYISDKDKVYSENTDGSMTEAVVVKSEK